MADQIAKVQLKCGKEQWVLVHSEVQTDDSEDFPQRMSQYYYRNFGPLRPKNRCYRIVYQAEPKELKYV